jgi:hypothetical protein
MARLMAFLDVFKRIPRLVAGVLKQFTVAEQDRLNFLAVLIGKAFGPDGIRHFSELSAEEQAALLKRVPVLMTKHTDWPAGLNHIPRRMTTWVGPRARILAGNTDDSKPIPTRGYWFITRGYLAWTTEEGIHIRFGFRYDDVDQYYDFPSFTIKRV